MHKQGKTRTSRRLAAIAVAAAIGVPVGVLSLSTTPAYAATVPTYTISPNAIELSPGGSGQLAIRFTRNRPALRWAISGLPSGVQAGFACSSVRACALSLNASPSAGNSTSLVQLTLSSGSSRRSVPFALGVHSGSFTPAPAPAPTAPAPTLPAATLPPPTTSPQQIVRIFALQPTAPVQSARPGGNVTFNINITRQGWSGGVDLRVDNLPSTWRAAFVPTNPTSANSTTLLLSVASNTPAGDYPIRISGYAGSSSVAANLSVRVGTPRPSLTIQSTTPIAAGTTGRFLVDVRSLDDQTQPVTVSVEGLPAGVTPKFTTNPAIGAVGIDFTVDPRVIPGGYAINLVATRDGVAVRVPTVLTVVMPTSTAFKFTTTPVTPTPGDRVAYGLTASTSNLLVARGTTTTLDVRVTPTGGFVGALDVAMDLPVGWSVQYSVVSANVFRATLTVPASATLGVTPIVVRSTSGTLAASINLTATVR